MNRSPFTNSSRSTFPSDNRDNYDPARTRSTDGAIRLGEGSCFSYRPQSSRTNLIEMADGSAQMVLDGATLHATTTGLRLTKGTLEVHGASVLKSGALRKADGIYLGDGSGSAQDIDLDVFPESRLEISGWVIS